MTGAINSDCNKIYLFPNDKLIKVYHYPICQKYVEVTITLVFRSLDLVFHCILT